MQKVTKIVEILGGQRSIQFIFYEKLFFDVRRQFSFTIERTTRHQMNQKKGERNYAKKNDHQADPSFGNKAEHLELGSEFQGSKRCSIMLVPEHHRHAGCALAHSVSDRTFSELYQRVYRHVRRKLLPAVEEGQFDHKQR